MASLPLVDRPRRKLDHDSRRLRDWLLGSGIQGPRGEFYAWYDLDQRRFVRPYPEITGYAISTLCWLFDLSGDRRLLERADRALDFLTRAAIHPDWHLVGTEPLASLAHPAHLYAFDSGMVAAALERLSRRRGTEPRARRAVERIAGTFLDRLVADDGTVHPLLDPGAGEPVRRQDRWSKRFSGYQLKSLLFLMLRHSDQPRPAEELAVRRTAERVLADQQPCGAFPASADGETHLHPHLYTLEALCFGAAVFGEEEWLERATAGFRYLRALLATSGSLPTRARRRQVSIAYERADILAQFLRVGSYLCSLGRVGRPCLEADLRWARRRLRRYEVDQGPHRGGVLFGSDWNGTFRRHVNCAVTLISAQARTWYDSARARVAIDPLELV